MILKFQKLIMIIFNHIKAEKIEKYILTYSLPSLYSYQHFLLILANYTRGQKTKYFELGGLYSPCYNYLTLLLWCESSHRKQSYKQMSGKILFTKTI